MNQNSNKRNLTQEERKKIRNDKRNAAKRLRRAALAKDSVVKAKGIGGYRVTKSPRRPRTHKKSNVALQSIACSSSSPIPQSDACHISGIHFIFIVHIKIIFALINMY